MRWRWLSAGLVLGLALALCSPAAALAATPESLPGSTFAGADGNQDTEAPFADWQDLQAAGRVDHSADPNAQDTDFAGGSKELQPSTSDVATSAGGATPASSNIFDMWASVDQTGGATFLYLAFSREAANGTVHLAIELNHDRRLWDNGKTRIPCRRTGDLLLNVSGNGASLELLAQRWTTTATDPATGCATRGELQDVGAVPAGATQGAFNDGPIRSRLPGIYAAGSQIPGSGLFAEAAFNLSALAQGDFGQSCFAFASLWAHSRSSTSSTANMQDYVAPTPLAARSCAASGTKFSDDDANGVGDSGEPGLPRFVIWADYNGDGVRQASEPFTVTDDHGRWAIEDIQPPNGT